MDDGTATSMAAKPPHASPDRSVTPDFDLIAVNAIETPSHSAQQLTEPGRLGATVAEQRQLGRSRGPLMR